MANPALSTILSSVPLAILKSLIKVIRVARPTQREGSRSIYFRERIPADVLDPVRGLTLRITIAGEVDGDVRMGGLGRSLPTSSDPLPIAFWRAEGWCLTRLPVRGCSTR